jgi:hypothetical protein
MGTPYTDAQLKFRDALEAFLRDQCDSNPVIIGKTTYPPGNPLPTINEAMRNCHGVIVVACERKYIEIGIEKRGGTEPKKLKAQTYTTPWSQIEASMAYTLGLPIYVIRQLGTVEEGLIEKKFDWFIHDTDLGPDALKETDLTESVRSWIKSRVIPRAKRPRFINALAGNLKFSEMSPKEVMAALGVISASFLGGAAAMKLLPKLFGP